jgi:lipopolysaccharide transport system ATP-binding protein
MSSDAAVVVEGLSKAYRIHAAGEQATTLRDALVGRLRHPLRRRPLETFWAIRDVDLRVQPGEVVGIIGGNGAGKSTLLKILCRITEPTEGQAVLRGRVGSLLEVGTGFHPELTGRENIYLNGAILGMKRSEITSRLDEIVEFSGIEQFIETPVKRYSSGMYVRLAFAVAAHLRPEILIVDEVLAVGDAEFQRRCLGKMEEAASEEGRTILFVSHNLAAVEALCTRAIYLKQGRVVHDGAVGESVREYMSLPDGRGMSGSVDLSTRSNPHRSDLQPVVERIRIVNDRGDPVSSIAIGADLHVQMRVRGLVDVAAPVVGVRVRDMANANLAEASTRMVPLGLDGPRADVEDLTLVLQEVMLAPGDYSLDFGIKDGRENAVIDLGERVIQFSVLPTDVFGSGYQPTGAQGQVLIRHRWQIAPAVGGVEHPEAGRARS